MHPEFITIPLINSDEVTLVDVEDAEVVAPYRWRVNATGYVVTTRRVSRDGLGPNSIYLHRLIMGEPRGLEVDHISRDRLDNRRRNLRPATRGQNASNTPANRTSVSGYRGVVWHGRGAKKWTARVQAEGRVYYLGYFNTAEEAARARDQKAQELHGDFVYLNFPTVVSSSPGQA
jgi:hypothetical protein